MTEPRLTPAEIRRAITKLGCHHPCPSCHGLVVLVFDGQVTPESRRWGTDNLRQVRICAGPPNGWLACPLCAELLWFIFPGPAPPQRIIGLTGAEDSEEEIRRGWAAADMSDPDHQATARRIRRLVAKAEETR